MRSDNSLCCPLGYGNLMEFMRNPHVLLKIVWISYGLVGMAYGMLQWGFPTLKFYNLRVTAAHLVTSLKRSEGRQMSVRESLLEGSHLVLNDPEMCTAHTHTEALKEVRTRILKVLATLHACRL